MNHELDDDPVVRLRQIGMWFREMDQAEAEYRSGEIDQKQFRCWMDRLGFKESEIDEIIADLKPGETHAPL